MVQLVGAMVAIKGWALQSWSIKSSALLSVRLAMVSSLIPASISGNTTPRDAPPAPNIATLAPCSGQPNCRK